LRAVFIHLGKSIPRHLKLNLERHRQIFPSIPLSLGISDSNKLGNLPKGVETFIYRGSRQSIDLMKSLKLSPSFRGGFWHLTLERLIALSHLHARFPNEPMLHIESDVLLMPNFPWIELAVENKMLWGRVTSTEDIAALLFSPSFEKTSKMVGRIVESIRSNPNSTDMSSLRFAAGSLDASDFQYLPSGINGDAFSEGIFDVATIGMWLTGMDPRNDWGKRKYLHDLGHHLVIPRSFKYKFLDGELFVERGGTVRKVFSLHIHSKDLQLFGSSWDTRLEDLVLKSNERFSRTDFVPGAFVRNLYEFAKEIFSRKALMAVLKRLSNSNH
jgi:hypothetical protein